MDIELTGSHLEDEIRELNTNADAIFQRSVAIM
jgi:hypothetical protein